MKFHTTTLLVAAAIAGHWWHAHSSPSEPSQEAMISTAPAMTQPFKCEGKKYCSEMTCDEAYFYVQNCPGVGIDGDHDGLPCERQC